MAKPSAIRLLMCNASTARSIAARDMILRPQDCATAIGNYCEALSRPLWMSISLAANIDGVWENSKPPSTFSD